ncbi:ATP-grasp domain-containing protein [Chitinophaga japonensis]|uniref:RimK-like ATP-grasp domain-containing protein n=1 Tax=Chitinophaga japonensis TaxID=104662 RepID=A0A562T373_CHIJA|nr:hypothetical protein [Chitinophaga japonensis]TWI87853.1 RimK-like ATP-grasp domain-containing protein [Chitinophaga japonensis]
MLLIITHKSDFTADYLINKLNASGKLYKRFNCEDLLTFDWKFQIGDHFKYSVLGKDVYRSIWFRRTQRPRLTIENHAELQYLEGEIDALIENLFATVDAFWLNDPFRVFKAENKLYQLKTARALGFEVPFTLVTNHKDDVRAFYEKHKEIIVKPISRTRITGGSEPSFIYTSKVTEDHVSRLDETDLTPCIFQQNIKKEYELRVTVVGDKVFAAKIDSQSDAETITDWRRKQLTFSPSSLPEPIKNLCILLLKSLGLSFGAIDLIKTVDGRYFFLEVNPNGQWAWLEEETGLPISDSIIEELYKQR